MGKSKPARKRQRLAPEVIAPADTSIPVNTYDAQLAAKTAKVKELFRDKAIPELEIFESPREHFRQRTEFRVWQSGDDLFYIMYDKADGGAEEEVEGQRKWEKRRVDTFPVASELVNALMAAVVENVKSVRELRHRLFQANFHSTLSGEAMVTLVYHRQLDDAWTGAAQKLQAALNKVANADQTSVGLIGRSKNQKLVLGRDFVLERLKVSGKEFVYKQVEGAFSQPNGTMCQSMLEWAQGVTADSDGHLLELYCGNGNFTIALAENFKTVIATEISKASVAAAQHNLEANAVTNVHIARLSSEEFTKAWRGEREFFRMKGMPDVKDYKFQTVLVDPPRAGLDDKTVELVKQFDNIVYISCNPATLHDNLDEILKSHQIKRFALFDQFPYTEHIECGVFLTKLPESS